MTEWWTYRLSDFLMFSPRTYWRLVENYNRELWPAQAVVLILAAGVVFAAMRGGGRRWTVAAYLLFALAWAHVGWSFAYSRYADIFTGAVHLAVACAVQAIALVGAAWAAQPLHIRSVGGWLTLAVLVGYPEVTGAVEWFGFMPDPTALATVFILLSSQSSRAMRIGLNAIPVTVIVLGWLTRYTLSTAGGG